MDSVSPGHALYILGLPTVGTERLDDAERRALLEATRRRYVRSKLAELGRWSTAYLAVAGALAAGARELAAGAELAWALATGVFVALGAVAVGGGLVELVFPASRLSRPVLSIALVLAGAGAALATPESSDVAVALGMAGATLWLMVGVGTFLVRFGEHRRIGVRLGRAVVDLEGDRLVLAAGTLSPWAIASLSEVASELGLEAGANARLSVLPLSRFVIRVDGVRFLELLDLPSLEVAEAPRPRNVEGDLAEGDAPSAGIATRDLTREETAEVRRIASRELRRAAILAVGTAMTVHELAPVVSLLPWARSAVPSEELTWALTVLVFVLALFARTGATVRLVRDARGGRVESRRTASAPYATSVHEEILPASGLVWTVGGRPGPDRLVIGP